MKMSKEEDDVHKQESKVGCGSRRAMAAFFKSFLIAKFPCFHAACPQFTYRRLAVGCVTLAYIGYTHIHRSSGTQTRKKQEVGE